jgi:hypothetical protein
MEYLKYEEIPKIRKKLKDIGVTTESQNRLPIFEPTIKAQYKTRVFENKYGKLTVKGRLGQVHKNLLETIFYEKELYDFFEDGDNKYLKVLYHEYKVRKYMSKSSSSYCGEAYNRLIDDMKQAYIELETNKVKVKGPLILEKTASKITKKTKSTLPGLRGKEIPLVVITFGPVITTLFEKELRFTYDPKPILSLSSGISQAIVRFLKTHKNHPSAGYHLKPFIENLVENVEGEKWHDIRRFLKKDLETLKTLGIFIDFKRDRLFVANDNNLGYIQRINYAL